MRRLASGIGAVLVILVLVDLGALEPLETWWFDRLFELRGARVPTTPIVIVTIDESSITEMNLQWPFPRARHADLIDRISAGRPLAIGVDLIFDGPSAWGARDDEALGAAIMRAGNVVLSAAKATDVQMLDGRVAVERTYSRVPLPVIRRGAAAVAHIHGPWETDAHIRRARLETLRLGDTALPAFDSAIHQVADRAGLRVRPLPTAPEILINFRGGPRTFPWVPYYRVLRGEVGSEAFTGKIVLVGATSPLLHDLHPTAFARSGDMPGIEIHANIIETLVRGDPVRATPRWVSVIVAVGLALLGSALVVRLPTWGLAAVGALWVLLAPQDGKPRPLRILGQIAGPNGEIIEARTGKVVVPASGQTVPAGDGLGDGEDRLELVEDLPLPCPTCCGSGRQRIGFGDRTEPCDDCAGSRTLQ